MYNENPEVVAETKGINKCQSTEPLNQANNEVSKVAGCYQYSCV